MNTILNAAPTKLGVLFVNIMWIFLSFLLLSSTGLMVSSFGYDIVVGKGYWALQNMLPCEDPEQYCINMEVTRTRINRTHDSFNFYAPLDREINSTFDVEIVAYQQVDGGFKYHSTIFGENLCKFVKNICGDNFHHFLSLANIDPPDCPIPAGEFKVEKFVLDKRQMRNTGIYGNYKAYLHVTYLGEKLFCVQALASFEVDGDYDDDDDDDGDDD